MSEAEGQAGSPIFLLCTARSGSTLLRRILDGHPEISCPAETNLASLVQDYLFVARSTLGLEYAESEECITQVRAAIEQLECKLADEVGAVRWADKSLVNANFAPLLQRIWPEAQFICVYRHSMDVIASAIAASPWGLQGFGLESYARDTPSNSVVALMRYWIDWTTNIMNWESENPAICHRVRYEELVSSPGEEIGALWRFLSVRDIGVRSVAWPTQESDRGPGDYKLPYTRPTIHSESLGAGYRVNHSMVPPSLLETMNELLGKLGYVRVDGRWGAFPTLPLLVSSTDTSSMSRAQDAAAENSATEHAHDGNKGGHGVPDEQAFQVALIAYQDSREHQWQLTVGEDGEASTNYIGTSVDGPEAPNRLVTTVRTLLDIVNGELNFGQAQMEGRIRFYGVECRGCQGELIDRRLKRVAQVVMQCGNRIELDLMDSDLSHTEVVTATRTGQVR